MAAVKNKRELSRISKACYYTDLIFQSIISNFRNGKFGSHTTEKELAIFIRNKIAEKKLKPSFRAIVAGGKNGASPHHKPTGSVLRGFVVIDFGVVYEGYMSDMTRTIYVGSPKASEKRLYSLVLHSQKCGINAVRHGAKCRDVDLRARDSLQSYKKYFIHGLGHGVGRRIHEMPRISYKSRFFLKKNMAVTVEPGVYIKNKLGIRIEDTCVVTESGAKLLTKSTKKLLIFRKK